ncbi:MAG: hypothetical protein GX416_01110 [Bacteroidales bacterium]|nr:hypothetical protein [Bacteroidales bacterium]
MKNSILTIILVFVVVCAFYACDNNGVGQPLATHLKVESSEYNVNIGAVGVDTTVATVRWIDMSSSYILRLSNTKNSNQLILSDKSKAAENNIRVLTFTDSQLLDYMNQMVLSANDADTLNLKITGIRSDGVADSVSTAINVSFLK